LSSGILLHLLHLSVFTSSIPEDDFSAGILYTFREEEAVKPIVACLRGIGKGVLNIFSTMWMKENGLIKLTKRAYGSRKPYQARG